MLLTMSLLSAVLLGACARRLWGIGGQLLTFVGNKSLVRLLTVPIALLLCWPVNLLYAIPVCLGFNLWLAWSGLDHHPWTQHVKMLAASGLTCLGLSLCGADIWLLAILFTCAVAASYAVYTHNAPDSRPYGDTELAEWVSGGVWIAAIALWVVI